MNKQTIGGVSLALAGLALAIALFLTSTARQQAREPGGLECLVPGPIDGSPIESTCPDAKIECHWQVHYCEEWWDAPTDCAQLGPADPDTYYGTVTWENYYCGCDMKCHPNGECPNGQTSELIAKQCSAKYGWPACPDDAFTCYWAATNSNNVKCPMPKCCGGWCDLWDPC